MNETGQRDERELLQMAREGDMEAFTELFEPLRRKIFAVACRLAGPDSAEDVVMDTYLKAWKALPAFDGRSALGTWLCRIAHNRALDLIRLRGTARRHTVQPDPEDPAALLDNVPDRSVPPPDRAAEAVETRGAVGRALETLPEPHRQALLLRYVDDLSYAEIAAAAGISIGTVMSRLFNAKRKLRAALERMQMTEGERAQ